MPELHMTAPKAVLLALAVAACSPSVPDSGAGVGFQSYPDYLRNQAAGANAAVTPTKPVFSTEQIGAAINASDGTAAAAPAESALPSASAGAAPIDPFANRPRGNAPLGIKVESGEMRAAGVNGANGAAGAAMSDEQSFKAVAARETIASDKERLARQRAQYEVVAPKALPQRTQGAEPNIVAFALATQNDPGTQIYQRSSFFAPNPLTACARYTSSDLAQEAFLAKGGPQKDSEGLDPDGDGFACGWDPRPFRTALR